MSPVRKHVLCAPHTRVQTHTHAHTRRSGVHVCGHLAHADAEPGSADGGTLCTPGGSETRGSRCGHGPGRGDRWVAPQGAGCGTRGGSREPSFRCLSQRNESRPRETGLRPRAHRSIVHSGRGLETSKVSINGGISTNSVRFHTHTHTHSRVLSATRKQESLPCVRHGWPPRASR